MTRLEPFDRAGESRIENRAGREFRRKIAFKDEPLPKNGNEHSFVAGFQNRSGRE